MVNLLGVTLSIWLIIFGYQHSKAEVEKNEIINQMVMPDSEKYSNPLPSMWKCIAINILSQVVGISRTIYFVVDRAMDCKFTEVGIVGLRTRKRRLPSSSSSWWQRTTWG